MDRAYSERGTWSNSGLARSGQRAKKGIGMKRIYFAIVMAAMLLFCMGAFARGSQNAQSAQEHSGAGQGQGAGEGRGQGMMTPEAMLDHMTKELNLTDDQQAKLK